MENKVYTRKIFFFLRVSFCVYVFEYFWCKGVTNPSGMSLLIYSRQKYFEFNANPLPIHYFRTNLFTVIVRNRAASIDRIYQKVFFSADTRHTLAYVEKKRLK